MKRLTVVIATVLLLVFSSQAFAASAITPSAWYGNPVKDSMIVIRLNCLADSDGTFSPDYQIVDTISAEKYWQGKYYLLHAWAANSATNDHTLAAVVTITDETGQVLIGAAVGDTLSLSTAASGIAYLSVARGPSQRPVTSKLTISIADTGSTATLQTIYLVLGR